MKRDIRFVKVSSDCKKNNHYSIRLPRAVFLNISNCEDISLASMGLYSLLAADCFAEDGGTWHGSFKAIKKRTKAGKKTVIKLLDVLQGQSFLSYQLNEKNKDAFDYQLYDFYI